MSSSERRKKLTIDEVNVYWRGLKDGTDTADLHKVCNAIRTLDLALAENGPALCKRLSTNIWFRLRNDFFDVLVTSYAGHFVILHDGVPVDTAGRMSENFEDGTLEFYPTEMKRAEDCFQSSLRNIHADILVRFRWAVAEGRNEIQPSDFTAEPPRQKHHSSTSSSDTHDSPVARDERAQAEQLIQEMYLTLASEATKLKKLAHRRWWQLHSEVTDCSDRKHKSAMRREMQDLEFVWGRGS